MRENRRQDTGKSPEGFIASPNVTYMARELLEPGCLYHIYNYAVGADKLFLSEDNYNYFLRRYEHFVPAIADTYCYCLIPIMCIFWCKSTSTSIYLNVLN
jgi:hypothetical protein